MIDLKCLRRGLAYIANASGMLAVLIKGRNGLNLTVSRCQAGAGAAAGNKEKAVSRSPL